MTIGSELGRVQPPMPLWQIPFSCMRRTRAISFSAPTILYGEDAIELQLRAVSGRRSGQVRRRHAPTPPAPPSRTNASQNGCTRRSSEMRPPQHVRRATTSNRFGNSPLDFVRMVTASAPGETVFICAKPKASHALPSRVSVNGESFAIEIGQSGAEIAIHQLPSPLQTATACCNEQRTWHVRCEHGAPSTALLRHVYAQMSGRKAPAHRTASASRSELVNAIVARFQGNDAVCTPDDAHAMAEQAVRRMDAHVAYSRSLDSILCELATVIAPDCLIPRAQRHAEGDEDPYAALALALHYSGIELRSRFRAQRHDLRHGNDDLAEAIEHDAELLDEIAVEHSRAKLWEICRDMILSYKLPVQLGPQSDFAVAGLHIVDRALANVLSALGMLSYENLVDGTQPGMRSRQWNLRPSEQLSDNVQQLLEMCVCVPPHPRIFVACDALHSAAVSLACHVELAYKQLSRGDSEACAEEARLEKALEAKRQRLHGSLVHWALRDIKSDLQTTLSGVEDRAVAEALRHFVVSETKIAVSAILDGPDHARAYVKNLLQQTDPRRPDAMETMRKAEYGPSFWEHGCRDAAEEIAALEQFAQMLQDWTSCSDPLREICGTHGDTEGR